MLGISGRAYLGHDGLLSYLDDVESVWNEWRVEVHRIVEGPDGRVAIEMTMHAQGKESGLPLAERTAHIWTLKDGLLLRNQPYRRAGAGAARARAGGLTPLGATRTTTRLLAPSIRGAPAAMLFLHPETKEPQ